MTDIAARVAVVSQAVATSQSQYHDAALALGMVTMALAGSGATEDEQLSSFAEAYRAMAGAADKLVEALQVQSKLLVAAADAAEQGREFPS